MKTTILDEVEYGSKRIELHRRGLSDGVQTYSLVISGPARAELVLRSSSARAVGETFDNLVADIISVDMEQPTSGSPREAALQEAMDKHTAVVVSQAAEIIKLEKENAELKHDMEHHAIVEAEVMKLRELVKGGTP